MRCLVYVSLLLCMSCATPYRHLRPLPERMQREPGQSESRPSDNAKLEHAKKEHMQTELLQARPAQDPYRKAALAIASPDFDRALYHCAVEGRAAWKKYRFSGLLFFRKTADSATHVVFQTQAGLTYFNFRWAAGGSFEVVQILEALNKPAIIRTLRKDFEILMGRYPQGDASWLEGPANQKVLGLNRPEDRLLYFFEAKDLSGIERIELWGKRRKVLDFETGGFAPGALPDTVKLRHLRAGFSIELKKINTGPEQQ